MIQGSIPPPLDDCPTATPLRLMIVAGEASGERYGALLAESLRQLEAGRGIELFGAGSETMRRAGVELVVDTRELSVIGLVEVLGRLKRFIAARDVLVRAAELRRPDAVITIDWPEFNFRLARRLRRMGFRCIYYVVPQVWAWRRWRTRALTRDFERLLCILPFEPAFFRQRGIEAEYFGHPLLDVVRASLDRAEFLLRYDLDSGRHLLALLPGSREREVEWILPHLLDAAELLAGRGDVEFVLPKAPSIDLGRLLAVAQRGRKVSEQTLQSPDGKPFYRVQLNGLRVTVVLDDTHNALAHSALAVLASGTSALEAAILRTPAIVVYGTTPLNWEIFRPIIDLERISLVNLIAGRKVLPELIQSELRGHRIAEVAGSLLDDPEKLSAMRFQLDEVARQLGNPGATLMAAKSIFNSITRVTQ